MHNIEHTHKQNGFSIITNYFSDNNIQDSQSNRIAYGTNQHYVQQYDNFHGNQHFSQSHKLQAVQTLQNSLVTLFLRNLIIGFNALKRPIISRCSSKNFVLNVEHPDFKKQLKQNLLSMNRFKSPRERAQQRYHYLLSPKSGVSKTSLINQIPLDSIKNYMQKSIVYEPHHRSMDNYDYNYFYRTISQRNRSSSKRKSILKQLSFKLTKANTLSMASIQNNFQKANVQADNNDHVACKIKRLQKLVMNIRKQKQYDWKEKKQNEITMHKKVVYRQKMKNRTQLNTNQSKNKSRDRFAKVQKQLRDLKLDIVVLKEQNKCIKSLSEHKNREYPLRKELTIKKQIVKQKNIKFDPKQHYKLSRQDTGHTAKRNSKKKMVSIVCQEESSKSGIQYYSNSQELSRRIFPQPLNTLKSFNLTEPFNSQGSKFLQNYESGGSKGWNYPQNMSYSYSQTIGNTDPKIFQSGELEQINETHKQYEGNKKHKVMAD